MFFFMWLRCKQEGWRERWREGWREQREERKTKFVPRSPVHGMMEGPTERGIQQHCVKREKEGGDGRTRGSKQANTNWTTC